MTNTMKVSVLLQLTFIIGIAADPLEMNSNGVQYKVRGGPVQTKKTAEPTITGGSIIQAPPGGMTITIGKDVKILKEFIKHDGKYYDEKTAQEQPTDPFHSVDSGNFIVTDCGARVFQVEGNMEEVTATPAATESAPTPPPVVVQPEERTLQEKDGQYVDKATGTTIVSPFSRLTMSRVWTSDKGNLMSVKSTAPVDNPACPTREQMNSYWMDIGKRLSRKN